MMLDHHPNNNRPVVKVGADDDQEQRQRQNDDDDDDDAKHDIVEEHDNHASESPIMIKFATAITTTGSVSDNNNQDSNNPQRTTNRKKEDDLTKQVTTTEAEADTEEDTKQTNRLLILLLHWGLVVVLLCLGWMLRRKAAAVVVVRDHQLYGPIAATSSRLLPQPPQQADSDHHQQQQVSVLGDENTAAALFHTIRNLRRKTKQQQRHHNGNSKKRNKQQQQQQQQQQNNNNRQGHNKRRGGGGNNNSAAKRPQSQPDDYDDLGDDEYSTSTIVEPKSATTTTTRKEQQQHVFFAPPESTKTKKKKKKSTYSYSTEFATAAKSTKIQEKFGFFHNFFGRPQTTKNKNNNNNNRSWDVNGPPVPLERGETIQTRGKKKRKKYNNQRTKNKKKGIFASSSTSTSSHHSPKKRRGPGGDDDDDPDYAESRRGEDEEAGSAKGASPAAAAAVLPAGGIPLHASETLQCRESVINFVINATDGKDECDGLIKAFDKTCSATESLDEADDEAEDNNEDIMIKTGPNHGRRSLLWHGRRRRQRRHRPTVGVWDKLVSPLYSYLPWRVLYYRTSHSFGTVVKSLGRAIGLWKDDDPPFFFAEEEVVKAWGEAQYLVTNDLDQAVQKETRNEMHQRQCLLHEQQERFQAQQRRLAEQEARDEGKEVELSKRDVDKDLNIDKQSSKNTTTTTASPPHTVVSNKTKTTTDTPPTNLKLPIKGHMVSDKTANDALLLQQGEKIIKAANEAANHTNVDKEEAEKSKQSISDTADVVSAVLNDPTSVEARTCCASILNVYHELCSTDDEEQVSDSRLFFLVFVMAMCGMVKSLIRHFRILWLPEAAGCIIVGVLSGYVVDMFPHHDISFDGNWFLRVLVPPIIFEAALSIDKRSFNRHVVPIIIYAVLGTLVATYLTAVVVHYGTSAIAGCQTIPWLEALVFGSLISSIDPIAVLSVLSNMGMNDTDTIYVLIFGESLLNDGVAIVLFHTLVHFLDETLIIDQEAVAAAAVHFFVVAFGSLLVGVASGMTSTVYYWIFYGCQTPLVEVLMFFCWALLPYYVCDGVGWSGIVAAVAVGFVMDLHIVGQKRPSSDSDFHNIIDASEHSEHSVGSNGDSRRKPVERGRRSIFNRHGHLSDEAKQHIGFVTEIIATGMETAIFAYLGFFLFSHRYHWNMFHAVVAILACIISRGVMIPALSFFANSITRFQQKRASACQPRKGTALSGRRMTHTPAGVVVDGKMQMALWVAGLRGAMSFALVEHIPLYDSFSGEGTRLKPELKAMTSASIMFTVFVLGGYTFYMMQSLGIAPSSSPKGPEVSAYEAAALVSKDHNSFYSVGEEETEGASESGSQYGKPGRAVRRQPHTHADPILTI